MSITMDNELTRRVARATLAMQRHDWEQGVVAQAFQEAGDEETACLLAVEGANRQTEDGRCCQLNPGGATDACAVGEALIAACERTGDAALCRARDRLLDWALTGAPRNGDGVVYHLVNGREFWVDSFYMLPPFLARAGRFDEALRQIDGWWRALWREDNGLLAHRWDDGAKRFVRRDAWGVGNGWALAGMARVALMLPANRGEEKARLIGRIGRILEAARALQREDGLFHDVLDDPASFVEVNFGQMFAYTIYRAVAAGWLDETWLVPAEKARSAAVRAVDRYGLVRGVCGAPRFDRPGVAPEGQAFFMLMEAARAATVI